MYEMRRKDRKVTDKDTINYILEKCKVLHLGLSDNSSPYIVPMNYGFMFNNNKLSFFVHSAPEGRKIDILKKNPECCVQMECDGILLENTIPCKYGYSFYSLEGFGTAVILDDVSEKEKALQIIMKTQTGKDFDFTEEMVSKVDVIRIDCSSYTAKHR